MIKKIVGITLLVAVMGVLIFGAVTRTNVKAETTNLVNAGNGQGNGIGNGLGNALDGEDDEGVNEYSNGDRNGRGSDIALEGKELEGGYGYGEGEPLIDALPLGELTQAEIDALLYMREEEKLARDVYTVFAEQWDLPMFANIASAEQTHMDSILVLLDRYELTDPASTEDGNFNNADLQALYTRLVAAGSVSLEEAIKVGGAIEEIDILDLQERLEQTDQEDIRVVFENLLRGSYNHLNAFSSTFSVRTGEDYQPQYMIPEDYQAVITAGGPGGNGGGRGQGRGQGGGRR